MKKVLRAKDPNQAGMRFVLFDESQMCATIRKRGKNILLPVIKPPEEEELVEWKDYIHPETLEKAFEELP